ncbi:protein-L-isoaspartate O-methyltransferase [Oxalobacter sp. OttesenSCG-928-P03]|nr:protein-L-isoaspartate O-methyltransferase [Oxalobacter sp. OttesenSCG-928-P03]
MDIRQAQINMIENQIRATGVNSQDIFDAFAFIRRENFVPEAYRNIAYADTEIPLIHNERMLTPRTEAQVLHAAAIRETDTVLEVGTGSGFMAALLAYKARHVTSVEIKPELKRFAEENLAENRIANVTVELGNGANGWKSGTPYDVIVISGALYRLSDTFREILNPGGRIVAFIGDAPFTQTQLIRKINDAHYETLSLFGTAVPLLREQAKISGFRF